MMKQQTAILFGLAAGLVTILYFWAFYLVDKRLMLSSAVFWGSVLIFGVFMWLASRREAHQRETFPFTKALQTAFLVFVIADLIYYIAYYLVFAVLDPGLVDLQQEIMREWLEGSNLAGSLREMEDADLAVSPSHTLLSMAWGMIGGFILSLGIAWGTRTGEAMR